jgi:hypothetical protein
LKINIVSTTPWRLLVKGWGVPMIVRNLAAMAAVAVALTIGAQAHAATFVSFWLTQGECTGACGAGTAPAPISNASAVEVTVTLTDSTHASVVFQAPGVTHIDAPVLINVSGFFQATSTVEGLAPTSPCGFGLTACASGSEDHFGTMNVETGGSDSHNSITITLVAENGTTWANAASVLAVDTCGAAYSHCFQAIEGGGQFAGYVDLSVDPQGTVTPLPGALPLFASGLGALGVLGLRRKRKTQATA